ncbi:DUF167 domain-containing protein, partial [Mesorhizobium sp. M7A.F.Ca.CA.001.16.1.1]
LKTVRIEGDPETLAKSIEALGHQA